MYPGITVQSHLHSRRSTIRDTTAVQYAQECAKRAELWPGWLRQDLGSTVARVAAMVEVRPGRMELNEWSFMTDVPSLCLWTLVELRSASTALASNTVRIRQRMPCEPLERLLHRCHHQLRLAHERRSNCLCSRHGSSLSCSGLIVSTAAGRRRAPPHGFRARGGWAHRAAPRGAEHARAGAASRIRHAEWARHAGRRQPGER